MSIVDFIHRRFNWIGRLLLSIYPTISQDIKTSGIGIHPEIYASIGGFTFILSIIVSIIVMIISIIILPIWLIFFTTIFSILFPIGVFIISGFILPKALSLNNAAGFDQEAPYVFAYLSVMVTGGVSPYTAFERLENADFLFKRFSKVAKRFKILVRAMGWDPLSAFEDIARRVRSMLITDVLFGYIATVGAGGDVIDYLIKRSRDTFSGLIARIKAAGERMSTLLESYLAISFVLLMTISVMYLVSLSIARIYIPGVDIYTLFFLSYILMPFLSLVVLYLSDVLQYREPGIIWDPYIIFMLTTIPLFIFLTYIMVLPFFYPITTPLLNYLVIESSSLITYILNIFKVDIIYAPALSMSIVLTLSLIPSTLYEMLVFRKHTKIVSGVVRFLRDVVEVRKTGLSPEKCIITLAERDYGLFSKYLKEAASKLALGFPLSKVYKDLITRIRAWRANVFLYNLIDAIDVGGGTPETLENIAYFAEMSEAIERERAATVRILLIIPYLSAIILVSSMVFLTVFMSTLAVGIIEFKIAIKIIIPAIIFNNLFMGLIAGKVSTGITASGFKHALILSIVSMITLILTPRIAYMLGMVEGV
ncbi:MAG: type II secretion system F family protein [Candidatus Methanomethylicia archaeon]|nr:type II secretion system F family protein [Candidatus Methanomethylicia archaeon]